MMRHQAQMLDGFSSSEITTFRRLIQRSYDRIAAIATGDSAASTLARGVKRSRNSLRRPEVARESR